MIGVFDSGAGGLTVLKTLRQSLHKHDFIYVGDTARLPYGTKSPATLLKYIEQILAFLTAQGVSQVVAACHSASSVLSAHPGLPASLKTSKIPLYSVIDPAVQSALATSQNRRI